MIGFANTSFDDNPNWGALLDNLHVADGRKRRGVGWRLLALTAEALVVRPEPSGLYLWVLEQNVEAFYEAHRGRCVERCSADPPGGIATKLRYAWREPAALLTE